MEKKNKLNRIMELTDKIAAPLTKFASNPIVASIQDGILATVPVIIIGSLFLIIGLLGTPNIGNSGHALVPFLAPFSDKLSLVNDLTMGFMAFYASISISMNYGKRMNIDGVTSAILGVGTFFLANINIIKDDAISISAFSASGLFVTMITSILAIKIYKFFVDKNITIKMPDSVPPSVGNAFSSMIPMAVIFTLAWMVRTLIGFNMVDWINNLLTPIISGSDNVFFYVLNRSLTNLFWSVGLHADNMMSAIFQPLTTMWTQQNAAAIANGVSGTQLPHIWTNSGIDRMTSWVATAWPLVFYMITSKVKSLKILGVTALPPAIFTIVEPIIFGLPLALNPFLFIPFLLIGVINSTFVYLVFQFRLVSRFFVILPWATPPFISGPLGTGDWKTIIVVACSFLIGLVIYFPFFRAYEKSLLAKQEINLTK